MKRQYDDDLNLNTVKLVVEEGKVASQVARDLGITPKTLYGWIAQYKDDPKHHFVGSGHLKPEAQETRDLERQNRELREENEILKKRCPSSARTGSKVSVHLRQPLRLFGSEDVHSAAGVSKRLLCMVKTSGEQTQTASTHN